MDSLDICAACETGDCENCAGLGCACDHGLELEAEEEVPAASVE